ncbi:MULTISPECIES: 5-oxoprolinase subunit B family protein [unclassified Agarivorans]|uniref:5-oxoprolinase subunit B family protein n=1 Tax=unclassified Agarivorans TaxID=2636026 RepID=UPI003D7CF609
MFCIDWVNEDSLLLSCKSPQFQAALPSLAEQLKQNIKGVNDVIVASDSLLCIFDYQTELNDLESLLSRFQLTRHSKPVKTIHVPACYDPRLGPDQEATAAHLQLNVKQLIELHLAGHYQVKAIGFMPGFAYLSGLTKSLQLPRKSTPASHVAAGSIAIAEDMSAVYPAASPGGWHVIGQSPMRFFDPSSQDMCPVKVGDQIRFYQINFQQFQQLQAKACLR